jgi:hypothetical protein
VTFVAGVLGAMAPEVIRWRQIVQASPAKRKPRAEYLLATICYALLAGFFATLIAQPNGYAAFFTGLTFEYAVAGALKREPEAETEELGESKATRFDLFWTTLRRHASYLSHG